MHINANDEHYHARLYLAYSQHCCFFIKGKNASPKVLCFMSYNAARGALNCVCYIMFNVILKFVLRDIKTHS